MSEKKKISPTPAQLCAIKYSGSDLLISAGAGSGKTATLTKRIVEKVTLGREDISRKLIVTFTKDAANELKARISKALAEILAERPNDKHVCEQMVRLGSADICTIDSFCLKLVREHFEQLGLDGGFRIADESEAELLCREAITEVIDRFYDEKGEDVDFLRVCDCFSSFSSEEKLKKDLLDLYKKLITTKNGLDTLLLSPRLDRDFMQTPYGKILKEHVLSFLDYYEGFFHYALDEIAGDENDENAFAKPFSSDLDFIKQLRGAVGGGTYEECCELISSYKAQRLGNTKKASHPDAELFKTMRGGFKDKLKELKAQLFSSTNEILASSFEKNESVCKALYEILSAFDAEYSRKKRQAGVCDFNDISRYAMRLLYDNDGNITQLAREASMSYDEVYVDEYQDTNYVQDRIFYAVSRNNRFLVGDIKQSIYRFRSAEPEIFSAYRAEFDEISVPREARDYSREALGLSKNASGASLFMSENFRCDESVINFSNTVSDFMFKGSRGIPYQDDDRLCFSKLDCDYTPDKAELYLIDKTKSDTVSDADDDEDDDEELLRREAEFVAGKIKELLDGGRLASGKKIEPRDIAILLRGFKKPVELYTAALSKRGIDAEYRGDEHFFEKSEVLLTLCILNAIDNPLRDVYLAGAMRSEVFGFSLEDMIRIRKASERELSFYAAVRAYPHQDELRERIDVFLERLEKYRAACVKKTAHEVIAMLLADSGIMAMANESERRSLLKLYDIARSYESGKYKGLYGFLRYVDGTRDASSKEQLGATHDNCVKLMSIHASKGLEFEVCFVAGCGSKMNVMDARDPILYHRDLGVTAYVSRDRGIAKFNTLIRRITGIAIKRASIEEEMRMLYVAMTRARSKLILTAGIVKPDEFKGGCDKRRRFASEYSILNPKCYMDWVLQAVLAKGELAKIETIYPIDMDKAEASDSETSPQPQPMSNRAEIDAVKDVLRARMAYEYPYKHLEGLPSKLSISRLYPEILDSEENDEVQIKYSLDDAPSFIAGADRVATSAERGTATHLFMQFCDYKRLQTQGARAELDRLIRESYISSEAGALVSLKHIEKFIASALFKDLLNAKHLWREFRFNIMLPASELSSNEALSGQSILVQGVCDCIYESQSGEIVLVDYKTDFVTEQNYIDVLTSRHRTQLKYYKKAVEMMLERDVSKTIIYSVPLAKTVELD